MCVMFVIVRSGATQEDPTEGKVQEFGKLLEASIAYGFLVTQQLNSLIYACVYFTQTLDIYLELLVPHILVTYGGFMHDKFICIAMLRSTLRYETWIMEGWTHGWNDNVFTKT